MQIGGGFEDLATYGGCRMLCFNVACILFRDIFAFGSAIRVASSLSVALVN